MFNKDTTGTCTLTAVIAISTLVALILTVVA